MAVGNVAGPRRLSGSKGLPSAARKSETQTQPSLCLLSRHHPLKGSVFSEYLLGTYPDV